MLLGNDPGGYAACCGAIERMDLRDALPSIAAPTLVVSAADDQAAPPEHQRRLAERDPLGPPRDAGSRRAHRERGAGRGDRSPGPHPRLASVCVIGFADRSRAGRGRALPLPELEIPHAPSQTRRSGPARPHSSRPGHRRGLRVRRRGLRRRRRRQEVRDLRQHEPARHQPVPQPDRRRRQGRRQGVRRHRQGRAVERPELARGEPARGGAGQARPDRRQLLRLGRDDLPGSSSRAPTRSGRSSTPPSRRRRTSAGSCSRRTRACS